MGFCRAIGEPGTPGSGQLPKIVFNFANRLFSALERFPTASGLECKEGLNKTKQVVFFRVWRGGVVATIENAEKYSCFLVLFYVFESIIDVFQCVAFSLDMWCRWLVLEAHG